MAYSMPNPRQACAAALLFSLPLLSLVTSFGIGAAGFLFLAGALILWRKASIVWRASWPEVRWVVLAFALQLAFAACLMLARGRNADAIDKPARMLLAVSAMLFVQLAGIGTRSLWWGLAGGACAALGMAAWQRLVLGMDRPGGPMNPITFGDLSLCLALLSVAGAFDTRTRATPWLAGAGALAGFGASLLSGSRGGWIALPLALILLLSQRRFVPKKTALLLAVLACLAVVLAWYLPQTGLRDRIAITVSDLRLYLAGNPFPTSLSVRLELWKAALMLVHMHPLAGLETWAYKQQMHEWVRLGLLSPAVFAPPEPPHMHNDVLQAMVTHGVPGLLVWGTTMAAPLRFFLRQMALAREHGPRYAAGLAGALLVLAYLAFGLTEVIFWSMKASLFYALLVFILMGLCLNGNRSALQDTDRDARPSHPPRRAGKS